MICPKCGFEQRDNLECARCGIVISRYKGPVLGSPAPRPAAAPPPPSPPPAAPGGYGGGYNTVPTFAPPAQPSAPPPPMPGLSYAEQAAWRDTSAPQPQSSPSMYGGEATAGGTLFDGSIPPPRPPGAGTVYTGAALPGTRIQTRASTAFTSGRLVGETFKVYFVNIIPFVILTMFALAPVFVFSAWVSTLDPRAPLAVAGEGLAGILTFLFVPIATAGINYGVFQQMRGGSPSLGACLTVGFTSLLPVLGLAVVQSLGVGCATMFFVIPGLVLAARWAVAVPAAVEEKGGIGEALSRSSYLTDGYRWQVFGTQSVLYILNFGILFALASAFGVQGEEAVEAAQSGGYQLAETVLNILTTGLAATSASVMYYRLRSVKESIDVDQISSVFD